MIDYDELMQEAISKKDLISMFQNGFKGSKPIDGVKLSNIALKAANSLDNKANKNTKAIAALCLLSIASSLQASAAQKLITKALGILG